MTRPVYHPDTDRHIDIAAATSDDIEFLRDLHTDRVARDHGLICEAAGGTEENRRLYVYKLDDTYWCRHFPGHGHDGDHRVVPESDGHKRGKDYAVRAFDRAGIATAAEVRSNRKTRSDVIGFGSVVVAAEIQASPIRAATVKARDTKARRATAITTPALARELTGGIQPIWAQIHDGSADWLHQVPSIRSSVRYGIWADHLPEPGSVGAAGVRTIDPEPCRPGSRWPQCPVSGRSWCGSWHPIPTVRTELSVDDVFAQAASGLLFPLRYGRRFVYLTDRASADVYAELGGNGTWPPGAGDAPAQARPLGPCRYRVHTAEDEQARLQREEHERLERERAIQAEAELSARQKRFSEIQRLARERREQQATVTPIRPVITLAPRRPAKCSVPHCGQFGRLYPGGWLCDEHKPGIRNRHEEAP